MKSKSLVLSLLLLSVTVMTRAQGFHLGVKAGANIFKIDGEAYSNQFNFGYNAGAFAQVDFNHMWGIQPELLFNQTNYRTGDNFSSIYPDGVNDVKGKLNYLTIPLLLSFKPIPLLSFQAGPQFGILLNQDQHLINNAGDAFKKGDIAIVGGAQLNLGPLLIGGRYIAGLRDINGVTSSNSWKNQGFQVYAGLRIF